MPLYYNTTAPTAGNLNTITRTATNYGIRDFLLSKNIQNPTKYPQLSNSVNGSPLGGEPFLDTMVGSGVIVPQVPIDISGLLRYGIAILPNKYKNTDPTAPSLLNINYLQPIPIFPQPLLGTIDYTQEDHTKYGILAKSDYKNYRKNATIKNLYLDTSKQIDMADFVSLQPIQTSQQIKGYIDEYGGINLGQGGAVQAADVIGSILNGQGIGFGKGGIVTNFDIRSSLAGRVLTAAGLLKDTKLGVIGGQQLALALANNAAFNLEQDILGSLNIQDNILSLVKGNGFVGGRPSYTITVPSSTGGKILTYAEKILGFYIPHSYLSESGSIFASESGNVGNIERANSMLENTGKGQLIALSKNIGANLFGTGHGFDNPNNSVFRIGYAPGYKDHKGNILYVPVGYAFMKPDDGTININILNSVSKANPIPEISWNREKLVEATGFLGIDLNTTNILTPIDIGNTNFSTRFTWATQDGKSLNTVADAEQFTGNNFAGTIEHTKKSLLVKTQTLFNSAGMKNIVSVKGDKNITIPTQIQTSVSPNGFISKGSGVISGNNFYSDGSFKSMSDNTPDNTFCRAWTPYNRYDTVSKLIRNSGLNQNESHTGPIINNKWRVNIDGSVLDDNGFVKIAPYKTDHLSRNGAYDGVTTNSPKKYMFSIENLAWAGTAASNLLPIEQGSGDLLTGKFGRMMWFPPYDLTFSETSSVNLESTNFIGRGEPVFTYNNTERSGNLSFKIFADHPSIMNAFAGDNGPTDEFIRSWFAGCVDLDTNWGDKLTFEDRQAIKTQKVDVITKETLKKPDNESLTIYFPNDVTQIDSLFTLGSATMLDFYESGRSLHISGSTYVDGIGSYNGEPYDGHMSPNEDRQDGLLQWPDNTDNGLNTKTKLKGITYTNFNDTTYIAALKKYLTTPIKDGGCDICKIDLGGGASLQGTASHNKTLASKRQASLKQWLKDNIGLNDNRFTLNKVPIQHNTKCKYDPINTPVDQLCPKSDRLATATFYVDPKDLVIEKKGKKRVAIAPELNGQIKKRFYTEADFFEKLTKDDPLVFDKIRQKIRYFHPSFHSMTPEGFNSRLTFLLQCTRQGATQSNTEPQNLAFGQPPVCILRIGDFYNTKIMIDSLSLNFEDQLWDLNPEGVGVQPMIATVNMSFKYIGGSTLYGPINKLQNALSFNYFANAQVYDPRANYIVATNVTDKPNPFNLGKTVTDSQGIQMTPYNKEQEYVLGGLDYNPLTTSMGQMTPEELQKAMKSAEIRDTVADANAATSTSNQTQGLEDKNNVYLTGITSDNLVLSANTNMSFVLGIKGSTNLTLSKEYNVSAKIFNTDSTKRANGDEWVIDLTGDPLIQAPLFGNQLTQMYNFNFNQMSPECTGLTIGNTYYFTISLYNGNEGFVLDNGILIPNTPLPTASTQTQINYSDKDVIDSISLTSSELVNDIINNINSVDISLEFTPKNIGGTVTSLLLKNDQIGQVYIINGQKQTNIGYVKILGGKTTTLEYEENDTVNKVGGSTTEQLIYGSKMTINTAYLMGHDETNQIYKDVIEASKTTSSITKIIWSNGSSSVVNFKKK